MNTDPQQDGLVMAVTQLLRASNPKQALETVMNSPPAKGERRRSLELILCQVKEFPPGKDKDNLLGQLVSISFKIGDTELAGHAVEHISDKLLAHRLGSSVGELISRQLQSGEVSS